MGRSREPGGRRSREWEREKSVGGRERGGDNVVRRHEGLEEGELGFVVWSVDVSWIWCP